MENEWITADMVEASEYAELSEKYQVYAVPLTVANDQVRIEGGLPEAQFIQQIVQGVSASLAKN